METTRRQVSTICKPLCARLRAGADWSSAAKHRKKEGSPTASMKMGDNEIGEIRLPIERNHREHHTRQTSNHEDEEEPEDVKHWNVPTRSPMRERSEPGEDLNRCRYGNDSRPSREKGKRQMRNAHVERGAPRFQNSQMQGR